MYLEELWQGITYNEQVWKVVVTFFKETFQIEISDILVHHFNPFCTTATAD